MKTDESQEMYLETIYRLKSKKSNVHAIDVAEELGYSKPSVSRAVGILKTNGYITVKDDGTIFLTAEGTEKASAVYDRHKILTEALIRLGVEPTSAEDNACRIEHIISEDAFEAVKDYVKRQ